MAATINVIDAVTELAGLHGNWMFVRFLFGLTLGAAATLLIASALPKNLPPAEAGSPSKLLA